MATYLVGLVITYLVELKLNTVFSVFLSLYALSQKKTVTIVFVIILSNFN